jgi:hypothetical protein
MNKNYKVKYAVYGGTQNIAPYKSTAIDVSSILQKYLNEGVVTLCISNGVPSPNPGIGTYPPFKDPSKGNSKGFSAIVTINNTDYYFACAEGGTIDFSLSLKSPKFLEQGSFPNGKEGYFNDLKEANGEGSITGVNLSYAWGVTSIQAVYDEHTLTRHGSKYGQNYNFKLEKGDTITKITGHWGVMYNALGITNLTFHTKKGHSFTPHLTSPTNLKKDEFCFECTNDQEIIAFCGDVQNLEQNTNYLDGFGVQISTN